MKPDFHILSLSSQNSKRPVKSIAKAEILASGEEIDKGKVLAQSISTVLNTKIKLLIIVESKDRFNSLPTKRNSIEKSIRSDVNVIRYEIESKNADKIIWILGKTVLYVLLFRLRHMTKHYRSTSTFRFRCCMDSSYLRRKI